MVHWRRKLLRLLDQELNLRSLLLLALALVVVLPSFFLPLWRMSFYSNQYPDGLKMTISLSGLEGQKTPKRDDLREINTLNHYIGMKPLLESDFAEFSWLPLSLGAIMLLGLRALVMGKVAHLLDVMVLVAYWGLFGLWSFYRRLYEYGHNLDPTAPMKIEPFTPPLLGTHQVANFTVYSYPGLGSLFLVLFGFILFLSLSWDLWCQRKSL